ncbi:MAG: membrane-binding protein [Leptospirales bacterium]|nr:membrane-binding protein [Leptospirales bacterium]MBX7086697.1 membrane-binding protein [Leptospirales bacterium]
MLVAVPVVFLAVMMVRHYWAGRGVCESGNCENGTGKKLYRNGNIYQGTFKDGDPEGFGAFGAPNGDSYMGEWHSGRKDGNGVYRYANGGQYEGRFVRNVREGFGTYRWADGTTLRGSWHRGEPEGRVVLELPTKEKLLGVYKDGMIYSGAGVRVYPDGARYVGQWQNGKREGRGTQLDASGGTVFSGQWKNDEPVR